MKNLISKITLSVLSVTIAMQAQTARADRGTVVAATIGGAIIGGLIGSSIAQNFDDDDNRQSERVFNRALRRDYSDSPYSWEGSSHRGRVIFTGEGYFDGFYCRIYRSEVWVAGANNPMVTTGYVCRAGDGSWFRKEPGQIMEARRDRPDRGRRFDPQPQIGQQMGLQRGGGFPQQQHGFPQQSRQMNGPGMGNGGGNFNNNINSNINSGTGTVITNGDALPISSGVN